MTHYTHIVWAPEDVRELVDWRWPGFVARANYGFSMTEVPKWEEHNDVTFKKFKCCLVEGEAHAKALADKLAEAYPGTDVFVSQISEVYRRAVTTESKITKISPKGVLPQ